MLSFLPAPVILVLSMTLYIINTVFWLIPLLAFSLLKALIPLRIWQTAMSYVVDLMANNWVATNSLIQNLLTPVNIEVSGLEKLNGREWYLVLCNHQSWVDIMVLQRELHGKIPFIKFFLKKELIYVPLLGLAWWALDFPFMRRYSQTFLKKNPHLIGKDIEETRKACEKFKHKPVAIMNFIEGTRFTPDKHQRQKAPFQHLLRPKAGGIAFVLDAMNEHLTKIVNVTIYYPEGIPSFVDFISGKVNTVQVHVDTIAIDNQLKGDYYNDHQFKRQFQHWVNELWQAKDQQLARMQK